MRVRTQTGGRRTEAETRAPAATGSALNTVCLENRNDDHFKFYRVEWNGCLSVRTVWGRIGTEGRSKEERFENDAALRASVESTLRTRIRHGYEVVSDSRQGH